MIATDDIGGVKHQRVKIEIGVDGVASDVHSGNPLPVSDAGGSLTVDGTVAISGTVAVTDNFGSLTVDDGGTTLSIDDGGGSLTVDGTVGVSGSVTVINAGTFAVQATVAAGATNIAKAQDAASANADVGVPAMAVRRASPVNSSGVDGDYEMLQMSAGRLWVDASGVTLSVGSHDVTNAGTFAVQVTSLPASTNTIEVVGDAAHDAAVAGNPVLIAGMASAAAPTDVSADGDVVSAWRLRNGAAATVITAAGALIGGDATNGLDVDVTRLPALVTGSAMIGQVGLEPRTSGGLSISRVLSAASTNATSAKGSAGQVYGWYLFNANAATRYLKIYDKATAPTVGTDTPIMTIPIPAGSAANVEFTQGIPCSSGIGYALTTGVADSDIGAVAANEIIVNLLYK